MKPALRWIGLALVAALALQLYFIGRIALMAVVDPQSTAFERSEALEKAWQKNAKAQERVDTQIAAAASKAKPSAKLPKPPKVIGGSTITQQLAKNLFLSGERTLMRKGQEIVLTFALETLLSKERILEIYLNNVEWGEGVFGAEAAAQHYYRKPAARLSAYEAARLAVMLPRPKYFEKLPNSGYVASRAATIVARMGDAELP